MVTLLGGAVGREHARRWILRTFPTDLRTLPQSLVAGVGRAEIYRDFRKVYYYLLILEYFVIQCKSIGMVSISFNKSIASMSRFFSGSQCKGRRNESIFKLN